MVSNRVSNIFLNSKKKKKKSGLIQWKHLHAYISNQDRSTWLTSHSGSPKQASTIPSHQCLCLQVSLHHFSLLTPSLPPFTFLHFPSTIALWIFIPSRVNIMCISSVPCPSKHYRSLQFSLADSDNKVEKSSISYLIVGHWEVFWSYINSDWTVWMCRSLSPLLQ